VYKRQVFMLITTSKIGGLMTRQKKKLVGY
jgi:hypothetical protein